VHEAYCLHVDLYQRVPGVYSKFGANLKARSCFVHASALAHASSMCLE